MRIDLDAVITRLKKDSRYRRLSKVFAEHPLYHIPFSAWKEEIERLHKTRNVRFLRPDESKFVARLIDSSVQDQAYRSRLVEMRVTCSRVQHQLKKGLTALEEYYLVAYASDISIVRTKEERSKIIRMTLRKFNDFLTEIAIIEDMSKLVIEDIDKAAWSMKLAVAAFEVHNKPESTL